MTVKVDDVVGVSGFVMPGSVCRCRGGYRCSFIRPRLPRDQSPRSCLQNIKVSGQRRQDRSPQDQRQPSEVKAVTLQVTPEIS
jgi:Flp pilus assembly protein CpaB